MAGARPAGSSSGVGRSRCPPSPPTRTAATPDGRRHAMYDAPRSAMQRLDVDSRADSATFNSARARGGVMLGLLFLAGPLTDLLRQSIGALHLMALLVGLGVFVALYLSLLPPSAWLSRRGPGAELLALALLPVIAIALLAAGAPTSFAALFVYV